MACQESNAGLTIAQNTTMKPRIPFSTLIFLCAVIALVSACSFTVNKVKKGEYAAATLADSSMKGYAVFWKQATNNPLTYNRTMDGLLTERSNVMSIDRKIGASMVTLDRLLVVYQTNNTVKPTIQGVLTTLTTEAADLSTLTTYLMGTAYSPLYPSGVSVQFSPLPK